MEHMTKSVQYLPFYASIKSVDIDLEKHDWCPYATAFTDK